MPDIERTSAGFQAVIPGCERRTLPKSTTSSDNTGRACLISTARQRCAKKSLLLPTRLYSRDAYNLDDREAAAIESMQRNGIMARLEGLASDFSRGNARIRMNWELPLRFHRDYGSDASKPSGGSR